MTINRTQESLLKHTKETETGCLEWQRCLNSDGYPRMAIGKNSNIKVHRLIYEIATGEDITGKVIRHKCDNPKCINPEHLLSGTMTENMADRDARFRHGAAKLTPEQVIAIRKSFSDNPKLKCPAVAREYGISSSTVHSIKRGYHWKNLLS